MKKGIRFYPFVDYFEEGALAMSYTVDREHIRLACFSMEKYVRNCSRSEGREYFSLAKRERMCYTEKNEGA